MLKIETILHFKKKNRKTNDNLFATNQEPTLEVVINHNDLTKNTPYPHTYRERQTHKCS